tara:strand:- start:2601 stop:2762 length:162 start_codon:yes stop_codon:yes gene_type:complete
MRNKLLGETMIESNQYFEETKLLYNKSELDQRMIKAISLIESDLEDDELYKMV